MNFSQQSSRDLQPLRIAKSVGYLLAQHSFYMFVLVVVRSPLYSDEVMEDVMEPFSQSRSMFLLEALLNMGKDSVEHTDSALKEYHNKSM